MKNKSVAEKKEKLKKPFFKRVWVWVLIVMLAFVLATALTMPFIYNVQTIILRVVCKPRNVSVPQNYDAILSNTVKNENVAYNSTYANGYMDIISPKDTNERLPLLVYLHGGYYVAGDKKGSEPYCRMIANEGYIVANVNYVLAPDAQYPAQAIQANEAINYLIENNSTYNIDINNVYIGGDSAGAHLSGYMGAYYTNPELTSKLDITPAISQHQLKGVVLLCGFFDMFKVRETKFPFVNDAMWMLTGTKKYENYNRVNELNTIENVTANYPNTYLLCGDKDPFHPQNISMQEKLEENNVNVTAYLPTTNKNKLKHEFQRNFDLEEANTAMTMLLNFLEIHSGE
ncbi:MAG TPA: alpha/beta hydrolase [Clostridia bacterium]|nr:alpha/beta hydrolase [Clostridia bacterium]